MNLLGGTRNESLHYNTMASVLNVRRGPPGVLCSIVCSRTNDGIPLRFLKLNLIGLGLIPHYCNTRTCTPVIMTSQSLLRLELPLGTRPEITETSMGKYDKALALKAFIRSDVGWYVVVSVASDMSRLTCFTSLYRLCRLDPTRTPS